MGSGDTACFDCAFKGEATLVAFTPPVDAAGETAIAGPTPPTERASAAAMAVTPKIERCVDCLVVDVVLSVRDGPELESGAQVAVGRRIGAMVNIRHVRTFW